MAKAEAHKWEFKPRFRRNAFGWKSQPAIIGATRSAERLVRALAATGIGAG